MADLKYNCLRKFCFSFLLCHQHKKALFIKKSKVRDNTSNSNHNFLMFLRFNGYFFLLTFNKTKSVPQKGCKGVMLFQIVTPFVAY